MYPATFAGLLVVLLAVLPGAVYVWSYERQTGAFNAALTDRVVRFLGISVVVQLFAVWPEYLVFRVVRPTWPNLPVGQFALAWLVFSLVIALPALVGTFLGRRVRNGESVGFISSLLARSEQPTRAWDALFTARRPMYVRVRTSSGEWIGGLFASESHAGGAPSEADLLLEDARPLLGEERIFGESTGERVYIPADKIEYIEVEDAQKRSEP